jgi:hypothetical protein
LTWNNGLWIGGTLIAIVFIYKLFVNIVRNLLRAIGFEE